MSYLQRREQRLFAPWKNRPWQLTLPLKKMTTQGPFRKNVGQIDINILRGFFDIVDELIS